jgi:hypothetical protein
MRSPSSSSLRSGSCSEGSVILHEVSGRTLTTKGIFTGVNSTDNDIIVVDVTSSQPQQQTLVARTPVTAEAA